jgi:predicted porin
MKKLVIATLLAAATGLASAQTVSVYGILDVNVSSSKTDGAGANTAMSENALSTSRLGFKGAEDLGGGLKAEFQLESKLVPSTGTVGANTSTSNTLFNRESWVGLNSASLGAVRLGLTDVTDAVNIDATVTQIGELALASELGTDKAKTVRYTTPTFAGFSAQVGYSNADATTTTETTAGGVKAAFAKYEAGKLGVYAGYESKKIDGTYDQTHKIVGAKYDLGIASVGAFYGVKDGATQTTESTGEVKQTRLSVAVPLGAGYAAHGAYVKDKTSTQASTDYDGYKLAVTKAFSNRTTGYVAYINTNYVGSTADNQTAVVGLRHSF